jgi:hypothetical protein
MPRETGSENPTGFSQARNNSNNNTHTHIGVKEFCKKQVTDFVWRETMNMVPVVSVLSFGGGGPDSEASQTGSTNTLAKSLECCFSGRYE